MLVIDQVIYYLNTKHIFWSLPIGAPREGHTRSYQDSTPVLRIYITNIYLYRFYIREKSLFLIIN